MKLAIAPALALAALSVVGSAQTEVQPVSVQRAPGVASIDLATGKITRKSGDDKYCGLSIKWANSDWSGFFTIPGAGSEWMDWGTMPASTSSSDIVGSYCFAYATSVLDTLMSGPGASLCTTFYDDALGWCGDAGALPSAQFCFAGLPASMDGSTWSWILCADLIGGFEFVQDAGPFAYSVEFFDSSTGPLLCYAGGPGGGYDANGQEDAFDLYTPDVQTGTCGTFWFGGYPYNFSSWYLELYVGDGDPAASCMWYCGTGTNVPCDGFVVTSPATLGGTLTASVAHLCNNNVGAFLVGYLAPFSLMTKWGELLVDASSPCGELFGWLTATGNPSTFAIPMGTRLDWCGIMIYLQAAGFGGDGITLHCAWECLIGF